MRTLGAMDAAKKTPIFIKKKTLYMWALTYDGY
jgi:hypothetical protein